MPKLRTIPPRLSAAAPKLSAAPKQAEGFYRSPAWRNLVAERRRDGDYFAALKRARSDGSRRVILDHVHERKDGGADLDPLNTKWLTFNEHQRKTAEARSRRARGHTQGGG